MTTVRAATTSADVVERLQRWIRGGLEVLWLLTVVLVPLVYFGRGWGEWSSAIGSFELPKIALLRTLVGLAAALWLAEWAIRINLSPPGPLPWANLRARPAFLVKRFSVWLAAQPGRLITVAVVLFSFSLILSTVFSASLSMSLWGDLPGQDSYGAYTSVTYLMLFAVISTHLKTSSQVWRLLGAVMLTGTLVAAYTVFQHYGLDFLDLQEPIGVARKSSTLGNPIFAATVLLMTIPITLIAATVSLQQLVTRLEFWWKLSVWGLLLAVQMLGIIFTFSRGPWGGTVLALSVFLLLTAGFVGWRTLARVVAVVTLGVVLTVGVIASPLPSKEKIQGRVAEESQIRIFSAIDEVRAGGQVPIGDQLSSGNSLYAGGLSGRIELWQVSWDLMLDHPWFGFDPDGLSWARPIIGYGPDLFRTAFLLKSSPTGPELKPREPGHTHNYFFHQGVELGLVGLVTSFGIFLSIFLVGGHQLLLRKQSLSPYVKLVLVGLLAMVAGRFVEQMVGVARVSDLTIFWALLALLAVVPTALQAANSEPDPASPPRRRKSGSRTPGTPVVTSGFTVGWKPFFNLAVVCLIVLVGVLTWMKTINYPRAALVADGAAAQFRQGRLSEALTSLDRAVELAPDVSTYYRRRDEINSLFSGGNLANYDRVCGFHRPGLAYETCRAEENYLKNLAWVDQRPFSFRSRFALAKDAFTLARLKGDANRLAEARRLFQEVAGMVPNSYGILNLLGEVELKTGHPGAALKPLKRSIAITEGTTYSNHSIVLQGEAYRALGQPQRAVENLSDEVMNRYPNRGEAYYTRGASYLALGRFLLAIDDLSTAIQADPNRILAYNDRGQAYAKTGQLDLAVADFDKAIALNPQFGLAYYNRALANVLNGHQSMAEQDAASAVALGFNSVQVQAAIDGLRAQSSD